MNHHAAFGGLSDDHTDGISPLGEIISGYERDRIIQAAELFASSLSVGDIDHRETVGALWSEAPQDTAATSSIAEDNLDPWDLYDGADAKFSSGGNSSKDTSGSSGGGKAVGKLKGTTDTTTTTTDTSTDTTTSTTTTDTSTGTTDATANTSTTGDGIATDPAATDGTTTSDGTTSSTAETTSTTSNSDPNVYVSGQDTPDGFNIEIVFEGTWDNALRQAVIDAAEKLSDLIVGDLPDVDGIDDIQIHAYLDDTSSTLGQGGIFMARSDSLLPSSGYIVFNTTGALAAVDGGYFDDLVMHEFLHALGFGTSWDAMGLVTDFNGDLRFTGTGAIDVYNSYFSDIAAADDLSLQGVPLETDGGPGTAGKHWDEQTFGDELMTGVLSGGDYLSDLSLAALEDMGYETIFNSYPLVA